MFLHYADMKCALDMYLYSLVCVLYLFLCVFMCVGVLVCLCIHKVCARVCTGYRNVQYGCVGLCVCFPGVSGVYMCAYANVIFSLCVPREGSMLRCACVFVHTVVYVVCVVRKWVWVYLPPIAASATKDEGTLGPHDYMNSLTRNK